MKFFAFILLIILISFAPILSWKYKDGEIFAPKMPANTQELANWEVGELMRLRKSLHCNDLPTREDNELIEFEQWRRTCDTVTRYWLKAYEQKKTDDALKRFRKLDLPK